MVYPDPALSPLQDDTDGLLEIKLVHTKPKVFESLLECIYTDDTVVSAELVSELVDVANMYQVQKLKLLCVEFMQREVSVDSFCTLFQVAPALLGQPDYGMRFLHDNTEEILNTDGFLTLTKSRIKKILMDPDIGVTEENLFAALIKWGQHQAQQTGLTLKETLSELLPHIRFPCMSVQTVAGPVSSSGLLSEEELLSVFHFVAITDEKVRSQLSCPFNTTPREGRGTIKLQWDAFQPFTHGVYQITNENRTLHKHSNHGSIYIIRTTKPLLRKGRSYWELYLETIVTGSPDLQIGIAASTYSWDSAWLKSNDSMWIELSGNCYTGSQVVKTSSPLMTADRLGFDLDYTRRKFTITRGRGQRGGSMKSVHSWTFNVGSTFYPVFAARAVGNRVMLLR
eukprot:gb/GEZN01008492.1/.p1 GENE.gb/GEZN01008492.1/~~gb/GEZN01008492.1/.p1  ORF type:complete len:410 (-),score=57.21 gb/GEZN01008492.1/:194-1384(-)